MQLTNTADATNLHIRFTVFQHPRATSMLRRASTWGSLVDTLKNPIERPTDSSCHLLQLAAYRPRDSDDSPIRVIENIAALYGIEADHRRASMSMTQAGDRLQRAGLEAFLYTAGSDTGDLFQWRILVPLSKPFDPKHRLRLVRELDRILGNDVLSEQSFDAAWASKFGRIRNVPYSVRHVQGVPLDRLLEPTPLLGASNLMEEKVDE